LKFRVKQTNFNGNSNINSNRVMYCGSYWETEDASQNNHQSVYRCP